MNAFTLPATTEGELLAEMDAVIVEIEKLAKGKAKVEATQIAAIGAAVNKGSPADSGVWNGIIGDTAHRIDKLSKMYADQINNMPKALRARIDDDFAGVLDSINNAFNADPSPGNAASVRLQVQNSLDSIEKDLAEASRAVLKASIEHIAQQKMTELQEKEMILMSVERGMTKGQRDASRALVKEIRSLILDLGQSNFLVYDKIIRNQKLQVIDHKLSVLETPELMQVVYLNPYLDTLATQQREPAQARALLEVSEQHLDTTPVQSEDTKKELPKGNPTRLPRICWSHDRSRYR